MAFGMVYNFIKNEALTQVFFCEFCEISNNSFFTEHLWVTASRKCNVEIQWNSNDQSPADLCNI